MNNKKQEHDLIINSEALSFEKRLIKLLMTKNNPIYLLGKIK